MVLFRQDVLNHLHRRLLSTTFHADKIDGLFTVPVAGDIVLTFYTRLADLDHAEYEEEDLPPFDDDSTLCIPVTPSMMEDFNLTLDDLMKASSDPVEVSFVGSRIGMEDESDNPILYVGCHDNIFGAAGILSPIAQKEAVYALGVESVDDLRVLPSSIFETLITAVHPVGISDHMLSEMITAINDSVVDYADRLSNHVYGINADGTLRCIC